jgi:type I restriction enzyme S subunit
VLYTVDRAIEKTEEIIDRVGNLKTGLIEQLTMRGIEHNEFRKIDVSPGYLDIEVPSSWEKVLYEDVSTNITYGFTSPMPEAESGPWMVTAKDIKDGRIDYSEARKTTEEAFSETLTSKSRPEPGTVLITKDGTLGNVAVVKKEGICINQSVASINPIEANIHPEFLALALKSPLAKKQIKAYNPQTTIGHIKISELAKWELALPPIKEQKEIISIVERVRTRESASKEYKQRLQRLKQGLMQDLLSGKVRTTDTNIEVPEHIMQHG